MKRLSLSRLRAALALALVAISAACIEGSPATGPNDAPPISGSAEQVREARPEQPSVSADGAFLRVTGAAGSEPRVDADGKLRLEVRLGRVASVRTLGLDVVVEGASVVEWQREDAFLRSEGGRLVALESRLDGDRLSLVIGTTTPVSTSSADGERVLTLVLDPTADVIRVALETSGDMRGVLDASGARLALNTTDALIAREGE